MSPFITIQKEENDLVATFKKDDEVWATMAEGPYYTLLKDYINNMVDGLNGLMDQAIQGGATIEEIGIRTMVMKLTEMNLKSIITKIERTKTILDGQRRDKADSTGANS